VGRGPQHFCTPYLAIVPSQRQSIFSLFLSSPPHLAADLQRQAFCMSAEDFLEYLQTGSKEFPRPGEVDVLCGGPPCQGYSCMNAFRSIDDQRNKHMLPPIRYGPSSSSLMLTARARAHTHRTVQTFLRIALFLRPRFIIIENVSGMISLGNGRILNWIQQSLLFNDYQAKRSLWLA